MGPQASQVRDPLDALLLQSSARLQFAAWGRSARERWASWGPVRWAAVAVVALLVVGAVVWQIGFGSAQVAPLPRVQPASVDSVAVNGERVSSASSGAAGGASSAGSAPAASGATGSGAAASTTTSAAGQLIVHVAGAVVSPGVVRLPAGARVADALAAAGGLQADADIDRVNLATPVADAQRIYVPARGQTDVPMPVDPSGGSASAATAGAGSAASGPINLNTATADQLDTLPGVGPSTAAAIIAYREQHGPFRSVGDLDSVRGIGPAKLDSLRDLVTVG